MNQEHVNKFIDKPQTTDDTPTTEDELDNADDTGTKVPKTPPKSDLDIALEIKAINQQQYELLKNPPKELQRYINNRSHVDATKVQAPKKKDKDKKGEGKEGEEGADGAEGEGAEGAKEEEEEEKPWGKEDEEKGGNYITGYDMSVDYKEKILQLEPEHRESVLCAADLSTRYQNMLYKGDPGATARMLEYLKDRALNVISKLPIPIALLTKVYKTAEPAIGVIIKASKSGLPDKLSDVATIVIKKKVENGAKYLDNILDTIKKEQNKDKEPKGGGHFFTKQECSFF